MGRLPKDDIDDLAFGCEVAAKVAKEARQGKHDNDSLELMMMRLSKILKSGKRIAVREGTAVVFPK